MRNPKTVNRARSKGSLNLHGIMNSMEVFGTFELRKACGCGMGVVCAMGVLRV